jgi:p-aminobenzoyl-glutamate transporter AbgT
MDAFLFELSHELQNAAVIAAIVLTGFYLALWLTVTLALLAWHTAGKTIADKITQHQLKQAKQNEQNAYAQARKALTKQDEIEELRTQIGLNEVE